MGTQFQWLILRNNLIKWQKERCGADFCTTVIRLHDSSNRQTRVPGSGQGAHFIRNGTKTWRRLRARTAAVALRRNVPFYKIRPPVDGDSILQNATA